MVDSEKLAHELGEISATMKSIQATLDKGALRFDKHDTRIRAVENRQHWYAGMGVVLGGLATFFAKKLGL